MTQVTAQNGKYVSTRWALGVMVGLLILAIGGWGKWVQAMVTDDHDELIRTTSKLVDIDKHIVTLSLKIDQVLEEHSVFMSRMEN